jgi:hypothetical protein
VPRLVFRSAGNVDGLRHLIEKLENGSELRGVSEDAFDVAHWIAEPRRIEITGAGDKSDGFRHVSKFTAKEFCDVHEALAIFNG